MKIGDHARFVLAHDIDAIIIGEANSVNAGHEYQVAWVDNGERKVAWVAECEIEGGGNDENPQ